jgi:hypothetical protein
MTAPLLQGRKLPVNDFEGDDATPGAKGKWVTCVDSSGGRAVAFATNGRVDKDGTVYRAALPTPDPDGIRYDQLAEAIHKVAGLGLAIPTGWDLADVEAHLTPTATHKSPGLIVIGQYDRILPNHRSQAGDAAFRHGMWFSHRSLTGYGGKPGARMWDALDKGKGHGRWISEAEFRAFVASEGYLVAYVPLQPL